MQEYLHHSRLGSILDGFGFHFLALAFSFLWFLLLWGLRPASVFAGFSLYLMILLLRRKARDDRLARREKQMRAAIGGELALERLLLSQKERAHFETAMLLSLGHPLVLLNTGEEGVLCDLKGTKVLIAFLQRHASATAGADQVLAMQRAVRALRADRGLLCVPCGVSPGAREQAREQPPVSFLFREEMIALFGRANPATDAQLVALGRRKKAPKPARWMRLILDRRRAKRCACYGALLLLMHRLTGFFFYAPAGLLCLGLASACRCVKEKNDLFER
jgi:hypothetical protein